MMRRVVGFIFVALVCVSCGNEIPHSTPSFIAHEHQDHGRYDYINLLIHHVHDATWHIPYANDGEDKNFIEAIRIALQTWLQPLHNLQLSRSIVSNFVFYHYQAGNPHGSGIPWDEVLFKIKFTNSTGGGKGSYEVLFYPKGTNPPPLAAHDKPEVSIYKVEKAADDFVTDSDFMFTLLHEFGHAFGLADAYAQGGGKLVPKGSQPLSVMASSYEQLNYPPIFSSNERIQLTTDDIKGIVWLYKKHVMGDVESLSDCHFEDYRYENSPPGCVPTTPQTEPPPTAEPPTVEPQPPTAEPPIIEPAPQTCADDPCADACLTGCRYRNCGLSYANPDARYRTSCYSREDGQWCGSADQGRVDVCQETSIQPPAEPEPQPPVVNDIAAQCCDEGFSCAAWPGKADIFLCHAAQEDEAVFSSQSPCCQTNAYECESWPGRAVAAICFGL